MDPETHTYGPPVKSFHYSELAQHVNTKGKEKLRTTLEAPRKGDSPHPKIIHKPVDLEKCALYGLKQYQCPEPPRVKRGELPSVVVCTPFLRLFRRCVLYERLTCVFIDDVPRCAEGLTVETTEWEFMREE
jgi:hypothetical protein